MALYVRSLRPPPPAARDCNIPLGRRTRQGTTWHSLSSRVRQERAGKSERVPLSSAVRTSSSRRRARNSFSVPVRCRHLPHGPEARRIPSPRFGTRTRNLFAQRQVAYGAMLISVRVSGLVLPAPARYAASVAAAPLSLVETSPPLLLFLDFWLLYFPIEL